MNNEPEVIGDIDIDSEILDLDPETIDDQDTSASDEVPEDELGDTQLGQHLGQLISEIRRDEESFQKDAAQGAREETGISEIDPFDPSDFSLDLSAERRENLSSDRSSMEGERGHEVSTPLTETESVESLSGEMDPEFLGGSSTQEDDVSPVISQLVSEIEAALHRFTQAERSRSAQIIAEKEAQVAEQYRTLRSLANKVAKQKAQIQEAKKELKAKLELADRLHIEFDGIRQVLNGKLGVLDALENEDEAAE